MQRVPSAGTRAIALALIAGLASPSAAMAGGLGFGIKTKPDTPKPRPRPKPKPKPKPKPPEIRAGCKIPNLAQCTDAEGYLQTRCGRLQLENDWTCAELIEEASSEYEPDELSVVPHTLDDDTDGVDAVVNTTGPVFVPDEGPTGEYFTVTQGFSMVGDARERAFSPIDDIGYDLYGAYRGNGTVVTDCHEFTWERFYEINHFREAIGNRWNDSVFVTETAFGPLYDERSIGTNQAELFEGALHAYDNRIFGYMLDGGEAPANAFFDLPWQPRTHTGEPVNHGPALMSALLTEGGFMAYLLLGVISNNAEGATVPNTWAWHQNMWETLAYESQPEPDIGTTIALPGGGGGGGGGGMTVGDVLGIPGEDHRRYLAAELNERWRLQKRFERLLVEWGEANIRFEGSGWTAAELADEPEPDPDPTPPGGDLPIGTLTATGDDGPAGAIDDFATPTIDAETAIRRRIIEDMLAVLWKASEIGCLEGGPANHAPECKWSPMRFVEAIDRTFANQQEEVYEECVRRTKGVPFHVITNAEPPLGYEAHEVVEFPDGDVPLDFVCRPPVGDTLTAQQFENWTDAIAVCRQQYQAFQEEVEETMAEAEQEWKRAELMKSPLYDPATDGFKLPGVEKTHGREMGNSKFGLITDSWAGFGLQGSSVCNLDAFAGAEFAAHARVFGNERNIVDVAAVADTRLESEGGRTADNQLVDIHARALGNDLFTPISVEHDQTAPTWTFHESETVSIERDFPIVDTVIVIVVVPLGITAGIAGEAGVRFDLEGNAKGFGVTDTDSDPCPRFELVGGVTPFMGASGFVEAAIDVVIAEAGIRGDLLIIAGEMPFDARVAIALAENDSLGGDDETFHPGELKLDVSTSLSIGIETLSGELSAYARVGIGLLSKTFKWAIVKWQGPTWERQLFEQTYDLELDLLELVTGEA